MYDFFQVPEVRLGKASGLILVERLFLCQLVQRLDVLTVAAADGAVELVVCPTCSSGAKTPQL